MRAVLLLPLLLVSAAANAEPVLRIATGGHTAPILHAAGDAEGRWLATGSLDKTVCVWDLRAGTLERTLRPPLGVGGEGQVYAVALSPDGRVVAAGSYAAEDGPGVVWLFERASGRMARRIALPHQVKHLAFSRDGARLLVGMAAAGVRVLRVSDGNVVGSDADYGGACYGGEFDARGRLVTASYDGLLRQYDDKLRLLRKVAPSGGKKLRRVALSPDGTTIAVSYRDLPRIDLLGADDLAPRFTPDTAGITGADEYFGAVAWSRDGRSLYAAGDWRTHGDTVAPVRRWSAGGRGPHQDLPAATNVIADLVPLPDGGVAFAAADPRVGVLTPAGAVRRLDPWPSVAEFGSIESALRVDDTGTRVAFAYHAGGRSPATFSVLDGTLAPDAAPDAALRPPRTRSAAVSIEGWRHSERVLVGGKPLPLVAHEWSEALAIAADDKSFVLGTQHFVRSFDATGRPRWAVATGAQAWGVVLSGDGRVVVAALSDGTLRWYRATDGAELLALFPHADRHRWIIWSPGGFYSASVSGDDLVGWHVNRRPDEAADFFPASRFRERFCRPDVIGNVLVTLDEGRALALANAVAGRKAEPLALSRLLPPVVTILSPDSESTIADPSVSLRVAVRSPSGEPITAVNAFVDGRRVEPTRGVALSSDRADSARPGESVRTLVVRVPAKDTTVAVIAETRFATGEPAAVHLRFGGARGAGAGEGAVAEAAVAALPRLFILAVGVSDYRKPELRLGYAAKDARDLTEALRTQRGRLYREVEARVLTDGDATRDRILDGLEWLQKQPGEHDVAILFLAGHGINDPVTGQYYFVPQDGDPAAIRRTLLPDVELRSTLAHVRGKALLLLDTCHAGNADFTRFANDLASAEHGVVVLAASTGKQLSQESREWGNGAFTKAIVEGLLGRAALDARLPITLTMLEIYLGRRVRELTRGAQTPQVGRPTMVPDFELARKG